MSAHETQSQKQQAQADAFLFNDLDDSNSFYLDKEKVMSLYRERINSEMSEIDKLVKFNTALTLYLSQHDSDFINAVTRIMKAIRSHREDQTQLSEIDKKLNNHIWAYTKMAAQNLNQRIPRFETFEERIFTHNAAPKKGK